MKLQKSDFNKDTCAVCLVKLNYGLMWLCYNILLFTFNCMSIVFLVSCELKLH